MTARSGEASLEFNLDLLQLSGMHDSQMYRQDFIEASFKAGRKNRKLKMHGPVAR